MSTVAAMDSEKPINSITHTEVASLDQHAHAPIDISGVDEKKLLRKIDFKLIPWLCVLYLLSFLDRSAIGNAKLYGLQQDLHLTPTQYNICLTVFFFPCEIWLGGLLCPSLTVADGSRTDALFEVPSNILLKRLTPRVWFPLITFVVGICML